MRHLITLADVSAAEIQRIFSITEDLKAKFGQGLREPLLPGRMLALLFEKQSLRTRVSFESGMVHLGGGSIMLGDDAGFGKRESVADFSRVLSEMVDVYAARIRARRRISQAGEARDAEARCDDDARSSCSGPGCRRGVHRRVGQHGPGERA